MGVIVKDKVYYIAEELGVPKCWVSELLGVSDTTLTKWSYNPENVSTEMSDRLFLRVSILEKIGLCFKPVRVSVDGHDAKKFWLVSVKDDVYFLNARSRLPSEPPKALTHLVRNALIYEESCHPCYIRFTYHRFDGPLSKIAHDKSLEMPLGVIRWEPELLADISTR